MAARTTPDRVCRVLAEHAVLAGHSPPVSVDDFLEGCTRALAPAME